MNYDEKIQASIRFTHIEPLDYNSCNHCAHLYLDINTGYFCPIHREVDFREKMKLVTATTALTLSRRATTRLHPLFQGETTN